MPKIKPSNVISIRKLALDYDATEEQKKNIVGKKIKEARTRQRMSQPVLAAELLQRGIYIQKAGISKWELGESVPNSYQLLAICHALKIREGFRYFQSDFQPELNEAGFRKLEEYRADLVLTGKYTPPAAVTEEIEYISMKVSDMPASAGRGIFLNEESFHIESFPVNAVPAKADFALRVSGDSMLPVYQPGQLVWVQQCESLRNGEVGIFSLDGDGYIKLYCEREPEEPQLDAYKDEDGNVRLQPILVSYNKAYAPIAVTPDQTLLIFGRVLS